MLQRDSAVEVCVKHLMSCSHESKRRTVDASLRSGASNTRGTSRTQQFRSRRPACPRGADQAPGHSGEANRGYQGSAKYSPILQLSVSRLAPLHVLIKHLYIKCIERRLKGLRRLVNIKGNMMIGFFRVVLVGIFMAASTLALAASAATDDDAVTTPTGTVSKVQSKSTNSTPDPTQQKEMSVTSYSPPVQVFSR